MSRIIKTVSLDQRSDKIASKKPNFSRWVREKLIQEDIEISESHVTLSLFKDKGICNPSASPRCSICYPYGRPEMIDIRAYNANIISKEELQKRTKKNAKTEDMPSMLDISNIQNDGKKLEAKDPVLRERKYLRRAIKWVWAFI